MRTVKIGEIDNFIVISDVHLRDPNDDLTKLFINTLDNLIQEKKKKITKIDAIFLLGDIFDFITVSKNFFLKLWQAVFNKFLELRSEGVSVYFVEGNHDFGFEHFHSKKLDQYFTDYGDFILEFSHKKMGTVVLRHGDNVVCAPTYHKPRAFFKSFLFQKIANLFFAGWVMHFICTRYAKKSRDRGEYNSLQASFLSLCIESYLKTYHEVFNKNLDTLFIGHIHVLIDTVFQKTRFLVGPDWFSAPSYLVCNSDGITNRIYCTKKVVSQFNMYEGKSQN